jgi:GPH family glycoside/pentoside/hexuronide:cation symporter
MQLVSMQQGFGVLGGIIGPSFTMVLVEILGGGQTGFTGMSVIYGFVIALMFIIVFLSTFHEHVSSAQNTSQSLWKEASSILRLRSFQIQIGVAFLVQGATVIFNTIIVFFLTSVLLVEDLLPLIILVASLSSLGSIVLWNWLSRRTRRWAFISGLLLYIGTLIALSGLPTQSPLIWVLSAVIGAGSITTAIFPKAVLADVIAEDQRDIGRSRAGLFTGLYGLSTRIGNATGGTLIGWLLDVIGYSEGNIQGLRWVIGFVPSVFLLLMIPCILLFRPTPRTRKPNS